METKTLTHRRIGEAWRALGADAPDLAELTTRYAEPHRAYHTLGHITACLAWLDAAWLLAERPHELVLAIAYHDVVYDPLRSDNERRSAALFGREALVAGLGGASTARVVALIESTATHDAREGDTALLSDIDLSVLGAAPHVYARYEAEVRWEFAAVPDVIFDAGRERLLRSWLETTSVYATPFFSRRLEAQARWNLSRSLERLVSREVA